MHIQKIDPIIDLTPPREVVVFLLLFFLRAYSCSSSLLVVYTSSKRRRVSALLLLPASSVLGHTHGLGSRRRLSPVFFVWYPRELVLICPAPVLTVAAVSPISIVLNVR